MSLEVVDRFILAVSDLLHAFARRSGPAGDPGFALIVAFDYYDGPEHGLAIFPSGDGVRFTSLGDSRSRCFRAFELIAIEGNWWPQVKALQRSIKAEPSRRVLLPSGDEDVFPELEAAFERTVGAGEFVAVGSPNLERLLMRTVTPVQLEKLRELHCSRAGFESAHRFVKARNEWGKPD